MVNSEAVLKRWKEYFEKLLNEENSREPRTEEAEVVNEEVHCFNREEVYKIIWLDTDLKCLIGEGTQSMKHNNNHNFKLYSTL